MAVETDQVSFPVGTDRGPRTVTVAYARAGSGTPLLLLHGIGHHRQVWEPVFEVLAAEHDVIAVDLPGFGVSPALPDGVPYTLSSVGSVLAACSAALGAQRPHVAGNSLGGLLALELGRRDLVRSVTALSPAGFWSAAEWQYAVGLLRTMRQGSRVLPLPLLARLAATPAGRTALTGFIYARPASRAPDAVVAETLALRHATGFDATLAAGKGVRFTSDVPGVPVTVAWGARDRLLPPRQGVRVRRALPEARMLRLPGCGHVPMSDDPGLVSRVILDGARG
jgi:pimeloyl-ACP methyl ester carboxylesterase